MKKFSVIFLSCLLLLNIVTSLRISPFEKALLPGNSLRAQLVQILTQVKQENNPKTIKGFTDSIRQMLANLQDEQSRHQEVSDQMMGQCNEEEEFRNKEIHDANDAITRSSAELNKCQTSLDSSEKDLPELEASLAMYEEELARATEQRRMEHARYLQVKHDLEEAIAFLDDFIMFVKERLNGTFEGVFSFVEKSEKILKHTSRLGSLKHAVPVLALLAQAEEELVPTQHNQYRHVARTDLATKLNDSLAELMKRLQIDHQHNEKEEMRRQELFDILRERLNGYINTLRASIEKLKAQIVAMRKCVTEEQAILVEAQTKLSRNDDLRRAAVQMCDTFAGEFIEATRNRLDQIKTIREILEIIGQRFGNLAGDLMNYLEQVENGWIEYENSTEFHKYIEYQQQHIQDNLHGRNLNNEHRLD